MQDFVHQPYPQRPYPHYAILPPTLHDSDVQELRELSPPSSWPVAHDRSPLQVASSSSIVLP